MRNILCFTGALCVSMAAHADPAPLTVTSASFKDGERLGSKNAFCAPDGKGKTRDGGNTSPDIAWSGAPEGTKSYALIVVDGDVPADFDNANKEGKVIEESAARQDFIHWVLVNIPASVTTLPEGIGKGVMNTTTGKVEYMGWPGINDYASFMKDKPQQAFIGYDGPCPPWNDQRTHRYRFVVYALDVEKSVYLSLFNGRNALDAIDKHILAKGELVGTYSTSLVK